jgi:hypothetical protein
MAESKSKSDTTDAPEATTTEAPQGADITKSRQAHFSTYRRVDEQRDERAEGNDYNPPPGPTTLQELGTPSEGPVEPPIKAAKA